MLFVPLLGDGFGDFLVGLGILFTLPEAEGQRDKGRRAGTSLLACAQRVKAFPSAGAFPPRLSLYRVPLSQHLRLV